MPTTDQIEWWLKTGSMFGLGFVAIAGFLALMLYGAFFGLRGVIRLVDSVRLVYLPQIVSGHLAFLDHMKATTETTAQAMEKLTETYGASMDNHSKTHRALVFIARAQQQGDICSKANEYLELAIQELQ